MVGMKRCLPWSPHGPGTGYNTFRDVGAAPGPDLSGRPHARAQPHHLPVRPELVTSEGLPL